MKRNKCRIIILLVILGVFSIFVLSTRLIQRRKNYTFIQLLWLTFSDRYYESPYDVVTGLKTNKSRYEKMDALIRGIYEEILSFKDAHPSLQNFGENNIFMRETAQMNYRWRIQFDSLLLYACLTKSEV